MITPELLAFSKTFLDWDLIKARILNYSLLKESTSKLIFDSTLDNSSDHYNTYGKFLEILNEDNLLNVSKIIARNDKINNSESLYQLDKGAVLSIEELHFIAISLESTFKLHKIFKDVLNLSFDIHQFKQTISRKFLDELRSIVDTEGTINFMGHPLIRELFKEHKLVDEKIRKTLQFLSNDPLYQDSLRFTGHDIINDRFVIAIKSDSYSSSLGQIIDRSDSGQTLYLEPHSIRELNQRRIELLIKIDEIVHKICLRLSSELTNCSHEVYEILDYLKNIDYYMTLVKVYVDGRYCLPELTSNLELRLSGFYHPLIENAVTNDFHLADTNKGLVISGPNTGGKTATLKAIAISVLFSQYGLPIPAIDAQIGAYKNVFYFGSDYQDLSQGLSSFSAEVKEYNSLFEIDITNSLIIIDEIFNSTSSDEASALAAGLIDELTNSFSCQVLLSTHHQLLKTILHQRKEYLSSHVGFDLSTNKPTYKLHIGTPGSSYALNIFEMISRKSIFKNEILKNARSFLDSEMLNYEELIMNLTNKENEIDKRLKDISEREKKLKNFEKSQEGLLKLRLEADYEKFQSKINKAFDEVLDLMEKARDGEITSNNRVHNKKAEIISKVRPVETFRENQDTSHLKETKNIIVNEDYFSLKLNKAVKVLSLNERKNEALVQAGPIKLNVKLSDLFKSKNKKPTKASLDVKVSVQKSKSAKIEYDCRGMRLEEFQSVVQMAISDLLGDALPFVTIIHGHGTGILKKWLRDYIKNNPDIKIDHSESGNDGETRIILS